MTKQYMMVVSTAAPAEWFRCTVVVVVIGPPLVVGPGYQMRLKKADFGVGPPVRSVSVENYEFFGPG